MKTMQTTTTTTTTTTTMIETDDRSAIFVLQDQSMVVFEPKVSGMLLTNEVQDPPSANHALALGEAVMDYTVRDRGYTKVKVRVLDDGANLMTVTSNPSHTWTVFPISGGRLGVETEMDIPSTVYAEYTVDMVIVTGSPPKTRAQRVIIKHKPL